MKGTSHRILSLVMALVLVLSMFAVVAAPVAAFAAATVVNTNTPTTAGAAAQWNVTMITTAANPAGTTISLTFPSTVVLPSTISYSYVRIGIDLGGVPATATAAETALAAVDAAPVVTGNTVQLQLRAADAVLAGDAISITISQLAGIKNPNAASGGGAAGTCKITVASSAAGETTATAALGCVVTREVKISATSAAIGGTITVTGVGFAANSSIDISTAATGSGATDATGAFSVSATVAARGVVSATDGAGSVTRSGTVGADGNWGATGVDDDGNTVIDDITEAGWAASDDVGQFISLKPAITFSPSTAIVGSSVTVTVTGLTAGSCYVLGWAAQPISITSVSTGTILSPGIAATTINGANANALGRLVVTVLVPAGSTAGAKTVGIKLSDTGATAFTNAGTWTAAANLATASFTVGARSLTASPTSGLMGATVILAGSGFEPAAAGSTVTVNVVLTDAASAVSANLLSTAASVDGTGAWTASIVVPSVTAAGAAITPGAGKLTATSSVNGVAQATTAQTAFTVLGATLTISPSSGVAGATVTITASGLTAYVTFNGITIDGVTNINFSQSALTDANGTLAATFVWPSLVAGSHLVRLQGLPATPVVTFTQTSGAIPVSAGFNSIAGKFSVVWTFDAPTQSWRLYDVSVPAVSDLTTLSKGQGYWLQCTQAAVMVYGGNVYNLVAGWNLIGWLG